MDTEQPVAEQNTTGENYIEIEMPYHLYELLASGECNLQSLCRICLKGDNINMYPLINDKDKNVLANIFTAVTAVQLNTNYGLPLCICEACHDLILQTYELKLKSEKTECLLKSIHDHNLIFRTDPDDNSMNLMCSQDNPNRMIDETEVKTEVEVKENAIEKLSKDNKNIERDEMRNSDQDEKYVHKVFITDTGGPTDGVDKKRITNHKCQICGKEFLKPKVLRSHMLSKHKANDAFPCTQCKEAFHSKHDLTVHGSLHDTRIKNIWICNTCSKEFKSRTVLRRHIQRHMEWKAYGCDVCGKTFTELYAVRRHMRVHTGEVIEKRHACHLCEKRYPNAALLAAHVARHGGLRPHTCETCGKTFPNRRLLASHQLVHSDNKPYACEYCEKRFRHESTRNTHRRMHTGDRPYVCCTCGKSFIQNSNFKLHMRLHTGERPYPCSKCDMKFRSSSSLKAHTGIHTGERPYSCDICGKRFARLNLKTHMAEHTGIKPFTCTVCPKTFVKASLLRDHIRVHTGEKPFECKLCPSKFPTKTQLRQHEKVHLKKKRRDKRVQMIVNRVESAPTKQH